MVVAGLEVRVHGLRTAMATSSSFLRGRSAVKEDATQIQEWPRHDPTQEQEWVRIQSLVYGGLIVIGVYMVQPFLTASSLDLSATICVIAFSVAIPLVASLVVVDRPEAVRRGRMAAALVLVAQVIAQWSALVGVVAGFWHITWVAGVGVVASGLLGTAVMWLGHVRGGRSQRPMPQGGEEASAERSLTPF